MGLHWGEHFFTCNDWGKTIKPPLQKGYGVFLTPISFDYILHQK